MRLTTPFDPIEVGEVDNFAFDFTLDMGGDSIVSTSWTCALAPIQPLGVFDPAPQSHVLSAQAQTAIATRATDGSLVAKTGFFSVASIGGMPASGVGATYVLEATVNLSPPGNRVLKLNSTVLCKAPGP